MQQRVLVAGASGFIGGHLVARLLADGCRVRAVGRRPAAEWRQSFPEAENLSLDLREKADAQKAVAGMDAVYNLAADIGGVRYIEGSKADLMLSVLINTHLLMAAKAEGVGRYFYSSAYAVSAADHEPASVLGDGHIWEKLFSEKLTQYFREDHGLETRVARLQNVYGPHEAYGGERERVTAALCRKIIEAKRSGASEIEIWGDGTQRRNFLYVDDAVDGIVQLAASDIAESVVLGNPDFVSINDLADAIETAAGVRLGRRYDSSALRGTERRPGSPPGHPRLNWQPRVPLEEGIGRLCRWIEGELARENSTV